MRKLAVVLWESLYLYNTHALSICDQEGITQPVNNGFRESIVLNCAVEDVSNIMGMKRTNPLDATLFLIIRISDRSWPLSGKKVIPM